MNFVVLMKQTPDIALVKVSDAGEIELPNTPGTVNPYDEYAVEEAIRLKERFGGKTIVLTMGSEKAENSIRDCLALGADEAYLVCDPAFENSDSQATARILAAAIKKIPDVAVVLSGKQSADGEAGQTPAAVAFHLGWPGISFVKKIVDVKDGAVIVNAATADGYDVFSASLPVVVSCLKEIAEPRLPSLKGKMGAKKIPIVKWSGADLGLDNSAVGANSPSKIVKNTAPAPRAKGQFIDGATPQELADNLYRKLKADQVL